MRDTPGVAIGTFGRRELEEVPSSSWDHLTVGEVMRRVAGTVDRHTSLLSALQRFHGSREAVLAVTDHGTPVGTLDPGRVLAHLRGAAG